MSCNDHSIDAINPLEEKKEAAGNSQSPSGSNEASNVSMVFARRMISGKWIANTQGGKG